jgi:hypothetical protein
LKILIEEVQLEREMMITQLQSLHLTFNRDGKNSAEVNKHQQWFNDFDDSLFINK